MRRLHQVMLFVFAVLITLSSCKDESDVGPPSENAQNGGAQQSHNIAGTSVNYVAADPAIYKPGQVADWAKNKDLKKIREHAWRLWGGITARTGQQYPSSGECAEKADLPVWDTWYGEAETFQRPATCLAGEHCRGFHLPRQAGGAQVLSFNKYSVEFLDWVDKNKFYDERTFIKINQQMDKDNTPVADRIIDAIPPDSATMLKPTFWVVPRDKPVMMPYWKGPHLDINGTLTPDHPVVSTWTRFVLYDPTGKADPNKAYPVKILGPNGFVNRMVKPDKIVDADDFYAVPLTEADVDYIKSGNIFTIGGVDVNDLKPCDLALLVGMHVTTAEFNNWTWQTFWWSPFPEDTNQPTVKAPFTHFNVATAYYFDDSNKQPQIAFNPYLEPPIEGPIFMNPQDHGSHSNCMTCHHAAAYPTTNRSSNPANMLLGNYQATGTITGGEQWFKGRVKTRFMWGMLMEAQMQGCTLQPNKTYRCKGDDDKTALQE